MSDGPLALSIPTEYVEVCFPAWPERRAVVMPVAGRWLEGLGKAPWEAALFLGAAVTVPGVIAAVSVLFLTFLVAFVLLAPAVAVLLAYLAWRHDQQLDAAGVRRLRGPPPVRHHPA